MSDNDFSFSFSSGKMVMLISLLLVAMCLCFLLGQVAGMREKTIKNAALAAMQRPGKTGALESRLTTQPEPQVSTQKGGPTQLAAALTAKSEEQRQEQSQEQPAAPSPQTTSPAPKAPAVPQPDPETEPTIPPTGGGEMCVQLSSSRGLAAAKAAVEELKKKGFPAFLETMDLGERGIYYRVMVGKFATKADAEQALAALRKKTKYTSGLIKVAGRESPLDEIREDISEKSGQVNAVPAHVPPPQETAPPKALIPTGRPYVIQVASVQDGFAAQALVKHLRNKEFTAYIKIIDLGSKGVWYRILVGDFETEETAAEVLDRLQRDREFKDSFIKLKN